MTIQGIGTREEIRVDVAGTGRAARIYISEGHVNECAVISIDANHLRALAKLIEAAADELDARAIGP